MKKEKERGGIIFLNGIEESKHRDTEIYIYFCITLLISRNLQYVNRQTVSELMAVQ